MTDKGDKIPAEDVTDDGWYLVAETTNEEMQPLVDRGWLYGNRNGETVAIIEGLGWTHPHTALRIIEALDKPDDSPITLKPWDGTLYGVPVLIDKIEPQPSGIVRFGDYSDSIGWTIIDQHESRKQNTIGGE